MKIIITIILFPILLFAQNSNKIDSFYPDVSINSLQLINPESIKDCIGDLKNRIIEEDSFPYVELYNKYGNKKIKMIIFYGSGYNDVSQFIVKYSNEPLKNLEHSPFIDFVTESGIKLGISKNELIQKKGLNFKCNDNVLLYEVNDFDFPVFFKKYNYESYFSKYYFNENNLLIQYEFGFVYP